MYDIAHRIGAYFGKLPENVYLHAGTRIGARAFNIKGDSIDPRTLPKSFLWPGRQEAREATVMVADRHAPSHPAGGQAAWHTFRRTFAMLLKANGKDIKVVQELLRHGSTRVTLDIYAQAQMPAKRAAQLKVVEMVRAQPVPLAV